MRYSGKRPLFLLTLHWTIPSPLGHGFIRKQRIAFGSSRLILSIDKTFGWEDILLAGLFESFLREASSSDDDDTDCLICSVLSLPVIELSSTFEGW